MHLQNDASLPPELSGLALPDFEFVLVEGGVFWMGDDNSKYDQEKPAHRVKLNSFYIGKFHVTQRLWKALMGGNPSGFKGENAQWKPSPGMMHKLF